MRTRLTIMATDTFVVRMGTYLSEMFPLRQRVLASFLMYMSFAAVLHMTEKWTPGLAAYHVLYGGTSVFLLLLILRLMDDIKDKAADEALFPERPLVSGKVKEADIRLALLAAASGFLLLHALIGTTWWTALAVMTYLGMMFEFFFIPSILKDSLPLTLLTHNPVIPLMLVLLADVAASAAGSAWTDLGWNTTGLLVLQYWAMSFSWEIARKIRSSRQESAYMTYSRILGVRGAVTLAVSGQLIATAVGVWFVFSQSFSWIYMAVLLFGLSAALVSAARFHRFPDSGTFHLRPPAEKFMISVMVAGLLEYALRIAW